MRLYAFILSYSTELVSLVVLVVVVWVLTLRRDPHRGWSVRPMLRRLRRCAGIFALAWLGLVALREFSGGRPDSPVAGAAWNRSTRGSKLARDGRWRRLVSLWARARRIGRGGQGPYPFLSESVQRRFASAVENTRADIGSLERNGLLSHADAGLLRQELPLVEDDVWKVRSLSLLEATCYRPMSLGPEKRVERLAARLPLLERLAASDTLKPEVLALVLGTVERDLAVLVSEGDIRYLEADEAGEGRRVCSETGAQLDRIRTRFENAE